MITRIQRSLAARRDALQEDKGFTLIELLVVVIIIGILAAIAIPVYIGVQNNAKDSAVQSDVANLKTAVVSLETASGTMPAALAATTTPGTTWTSAGATVSSNNNGIVYKPSSTTGSTAFCVAGISSTGSVFVGSDSAGITKSTATTLAAACP